MNLTQLLLRALETGAEADRVRFMAEVGRLIARQVRASDMWEVENGPRYFGFEDHRRWSDIYPRDFEANLMRYAGADPTTDFFLGSHGSEAGAQKADGTEPAGAQRRVSRFELAFGESGRLAAMVRNGDDIGGYLATMVRNYLHERQKRNDPVGYRVFKNLEAVIEELDDADVVLVTGRVGRRERIRRSTRIRFRAPDSEGHAPEPVTVVLAALGGNVHKLAKLGRGAQRLLRPAVEGLPEACVTEFIFGDLLAPLQEHVREAARIWGGEPPGGPLETDESKILEKIRITDPAAGYTTLDEQLTALADKVRTAIEQGGFQERTRLGLKRVLDDWFGHLAETQADGDEHPPLTGWALRLGLKRATLGDHVQRLRALIARVTDARDGSGS
jgi:hypothetical protein